MSLPSFGNHIADCMRLLGYEPCRGRLGGIEKEMTDVRVAFKTLNQGDEPPPGYQYMQCHMIFEIKLDGF